MAKLTKKEQEALRPETLALSLGFDPWLSEGAIKTPVFLTSTFAFKKAADGKKFFGWLHGKGRASKERMGLVYSRINNPNLEIFEDRIALYDGMKRGISFSSGMAAITNALLALHEPGDELIACMPVYGGTDGFMHDFLPRHGVKIRFVPAGPGAAAAAAKVLSKRTRSIFIETPANPNNRLTDVAAMSRLARSSKGRRVYVLVDNTLNGPVFSKPARLGADVVLYSATKFIGGHSDIVAGVATASDEEIVTRILRHRAVFGGMPNPYTAWLLTRSLETLQVRMERQQANAAEVAAFLDCHPKVAKVYYLGLLTAGDPEHAIYQRQYTGPGSMISFDIKGGERRAFKFLDSLKLFKLAVSLGSTESLAQHPASMTHHAVSPAIKRMGGITGSMVRLSIGIEHPADLVWDLEQALAAV